MQEYKGVLTFIKIINIMFFTIPSKTLSLVGPELPERLANTLNIKVDRLS